MDRRRDSPPLLFSIPFQVISPSSSPLPRTSISMQHSHKEQTSDSPRCNQRAQGLAMSRPHTQVTEGNKTLERINGERGSCGCKKEAVVDHLLPAEGRGEQAFCLSRFFSSSSSETAVNHCFWSGGGDGGSGAAFGNSDSSLGQQDEEDSLEEVAKAANSGHEPVGAKAGVSIHHAFCDVCLMRREQR